MASQVAQASTSDLVEIGAPRPGGSTTPARPAESPLSQRERAVLRTAIVLPGRVRPMIPTRL